jgi:hypothetical protein
MDTKDWLVVSLVGAAAVTAWQLFHSPETRAVPPRNDDARGPRGAGMVKGRRVRFELEDHRIVTLPAGHAMVHDPKGIDFPRCHIYFGPLQKTQKGTDLRREGRAYFGSSYPARVARIEVPDGAWHPVGHVIQIFYERPGKHKGLYYHPFKTRLPQKLVLSKNGSMYRLTLPQGCIVNDRGFVYP